MKRVYPLTELIPLPDDYTNAFAVFVVVVVTAVVRFFHSVVFIYYFLVLVSRSLKKLHASEHIMCRHFIEWFAL